MKIMILTVKLETDTRLTLTLSIIHHLLLDPSLPLIIQYHPFADPHLSCAWMV